MTDPRISIVMAAWNVADTIGDAIDSVARQTYPHRELLIADGASSDGTVDIIQAAADKGQVQWTASEPDQGISDAWNKALAHVTGDWIYFLGADDRLQGDDTLEKVAVHLRDAREKIVYGQVHIVMDDDRILRTEGRPWDETRDLFFQVNALPHQGVFHHRSLFDELGNFNPDYRIAGDYEFLMRALKDGAPARFMDLPVAAMAEGGVSSTISGLLAMYDEFDRIRQAHGVTAPAPYLEQKRREARFHHRLNRLLTPRGALALVNLWRRLTGKPLKKTHV